MKDLNQSPTGREIFVWNILSSITNSLLSMVALMLVVRAFDSEEADIFSIAWSIAQMMATIGTFQIRTYQATDVTEKFKFGQYLRFRVLCVSVMMISSIGYVLIKQYDSYKAIIVLLICMFRAVDSLADVYEGYFQQKERLDLAGKAVTYRVVMAMMFLACSVFAFKNLLLSSIVLFLSYAVSWILFDVRYLYGVQQFRIKDKWNKGVKWIVVLMKEGTPIFVNAFLMAAITNAPKIEIDSAITSGIMSDGTQTIFNIIFMPASALTIAYIVFRPLLTKMAIAWNSKRKKQFLKIIGMILLCLGIMEIVLLIGSALLGVPILSILYAVDLKAYKMELLMMVVGGGFCTFSYVLDNALIVIRKQNLLICSYVISWICVKLVLASFVQTYGLMGAVMAYAVSMAIFFVVTLMIFIVCLKKEKEHG